MKKPVTEKKRKANQHNSAKSTGPRTDRGKLNSRFNAVKFGLFASEVVIPDCDGEDASRKFSELLLDLQRETESEGRLENLLMEVAAAGFWRVRRTVLAEYGSTRIEGFWNKCPELPKGSFIEKLYKSVDTERFCLRALNKAREEIRQTGGLCPESYNGIRVLVEEQPNNPSNSDNDSASEPVIDDDFVHRLEQKAESLLFTILQVECRLATRNADSLKQSVLPTAEEIEKISRCRIRAQKDVAWAFQTLYFLRKKRGHQKLRSFSTTDGHEEVEGDRNA